MKIKGKPQVGLMFIKSMYPEMAGLSNLVDFFQVPGEDYFGTQATHDFENLAMLSKNKPLHIHSIDLSIGSADGIDERVLKDIEYVVKNISIESFSDHVGFSKIARYWTGMPILNPPLTVESVKVMSRNISLIRKIIKNKPFYIENNSHCINWPNSTLSESEFTNIVVKTSKAKILLDIPNMLADARNYDFNPYQFIDTLSTQEVEMVHLAGGDWLDGYKKGEITRGHNKKVEEETWDLFTYVLSKCPIKYVVLERSRNINYGEIADDINKLRTLVEQHI